MESYSWVCTDIGERSNNLFVLGTKFKEQIAGLVRSQQVNDFLIVISQSQCRVYLHESVGLLHHNTLVL